MVSFISKSIYPYWSFYKYIYVIPKFGSTSLSHWLEAKRRGAWSRAGLDKMKRFVAVCRKKYNF